MYLADVVSGDDWSVPVCLACARAYPLQGSTPFTIQLHPDLTHLESVAQSFEQLLRQPKPQGLPEGTYYSAPKARVDIYANIHSARPNARSSAFNCIFDFAQVPHTCYALPARLSDHLLTAESVSLALYLWLDA